MTTYDRFGVDDGALQRALAPIADGDADAIVAEARRAARDVVVAELRDALAEALRSTVRERLKGDLPTRDGERPPPAIDEPAPVKAEPDRTEAGAGWYVFGVTECDPAAVSGWAGMDPDGPTVGIGVRRLVAVASSVTLRQFEEEEFRAHVDDVEWLEAKIRVHEAVLERMLGVGPTLPMRFGSIYRTRDDVEEMLRRHERTLEAGLERVRDREEWTVRARLDRDGLASWARRRSSPPGPDDPPAGAGEGLAYMAERARERELADAMDAEVSRASARVERSLSGLAVEAVRSDVPVRRGTDVAFQLSFLVDRSRAREFTTAASWLRDELESRGIGLEVTGPWPPSSFTSMELTVEAGS